MHARASTECEEEGEEEEVLTPLLMRLGDILIRVL